MSCVSHSPSINNTNSITVMNIFLSPSRRVFHFHFSFFKFPIWLLSPKLFTLSPPGSRSIDQLNNPIAEQQTQHSKLSLPPVIQMLEDDLQIFRSGPITWIIYFAKWLVAIVIDGWWQQQAYIIHSTASKTNGDCLGQISAWWRSGWSCVRKNLLIILFIFVVVVLHAD